MKTDSRPDPSIDAAARADREAGKAALHRPDWPKDGAPAQVASDRRPAFHESDQDAARATLHKRVDNDFVYHTPTQEMVPQFALLRSIARNLAHEIIRNTPPGRELSLALTSLEESIMWANAGISRQAQPGQQASASAALQAGQQEAPPAPNVKDPRQNAPPFAR